MSTSVIVPLAQVWTSYPIHFFFQNHFCNLIEFSMTKKYLKFNLSHTLSLIFFKAPFFTKSYLLKAFQQYQEQAQIPL
jgi:hypothetical protein